jgi:hypothetical protein
MARLTVGVAVAVVARQQPFQGVDQVVIGACAGLDDGHPPFACTNTLHKPSSCSRQNDRTASVRSTIRRRDVSMSSTSESTASSLRTINLLNRKKPIHHREAPIETAAGREEADEWSGGATGAPPQQESGWIVHARTTSIQAQPARIDAGIAHVRDEVMPALEALGGFVGLSLLVDRESGQCIATSAWETEETQLSSAEKVEPIRDRAAEVFGGTATAETWEIGVLHRDHRSNDGACVRVTWIKVPPDNAELATDFYRTSVLPSLDNLEGFCSASLLINRSTGRAVSSSTFDSREAMERNREHAKELRNARTREIGADILDVGEFELAIAHLRVPEVA